jgi:hypothetical protein
MNQEQLFRAAKAIREKIAAGEIISSDAMALAELDDLIRRADSGDEILAPLLDLFEKTPGWFDWLEAFAASEWPSAPKERSIGMYVPLLGESLTSRIEKYRCTEDGCQWIGIRHSEHDPKPVCKQHGTSRPMAG